MRNLNDYVSIEVYFSDDLPPNLQKIKEDVADIVTEFKVYGGDKIKVEWKDPKPNSVDKQSALSYGIQQERVAIVDKDKESYVKVITGIVVRFANRAEAIPIIRNTDNLEYELIKRVNLVLNPERLKVGIFRTDSYREINLTKKLYGKLYEELGKSFDVEEIDITKTHEIDPSISTVVVPGGDSTFWANPYTIAALDQYFMKGGHLVVLANRIAVNTQQSPYGKLENSTIFELLKNYGVIVEPKLVADISSGKIPIQQKVDGVIKTYPVDYPLFVKIIKSGVTDKSPAIAGFSGMEFQWPSPLSVADSLDTNITIDTLVTTTPVAFTIDKPYSLNPRVVWDKKLELAKKAGTVGKYPLVFRAHGTFKSLYKNDTITEGLVKEVQDNSLIVVGNSRFIVSGGRINTLFMSNLIDWITTNDKLLSIKNRVVVDRSFKDYMYKDGSAKKIKFYRIINIALMPILLIIGGIILFIIRKKAQKEN